MDDKTPSPRIALVAEGPSDHAVLRSFLAAYFRDPDIVVRPLQPPPNTPGGWTEVLRYLASPELPAAFADNDHVVVQIDTDVCEEVGYGVPRRDEHGQPLPPDALAERVQARLTAQLSPDLGDLAGRILFAICVDSLECWLLPLVHSDNRRERTVNCLSALNRELSARHGYSIDPSNKQVAYYDRLLRQYKCHRYTTLAGIADRQPSLARFIARLDRQFPAQSMLPPRGP